MDTFINQFVIDSFVQEIKDLAEVFPVSAAKAARDSVEESQVLVDKVDREVSEG